MAACRYVDQELMESLAPAGVEIPPVYPGSIQGVCRICAMPVWIGPMVQAVMERNPDSVWVMCFLCSLREPVGLVVNLGNDFKPRKDTQQ